MKSKFLSLVLLAGILGSAAGLDAADQTKNPDDAAIRKNLAAYLAAYGQQDAAALAALWSEDGHFLSPTTGKSIIGRKGIEEEYRALFKEEPKAILTVDEVTIRFLTKDVAVEEGVAHVTAPDAPATSDTYQAIHVKKGARWFIDSVRETAAANDPDETAPSKPAPAEKSPIPELEKLAWMIGDWVDSGDGSSVSHSCSWGMGKCFIRKDFSVVVEGLIQMEGIEVIGWDPAEKLFRSWVFDSGGGFGSATWTQSEDGWIKKISGTTREGKKVYAEHSIRLLNENTYQFEAHGREADGVLLPNIPLTEIVRVTEEAQEK